MLQDDLGAVLVKDCKLSVNTQMNAVANPVNVRNADSLTVEDSTLTGDGNNDHAIYLISVRAVLVQRNLIRNHGNSAVKLLTGGFRADACPVPGVGGDYSSWVLRNNIIADSKLALAAYTYCDVHLPLLVIAENQIRNIANTYAGDAAAIYIQANCQSVIERVMMSGNVFRDIGLSGVFLLTSIQGGPPCADLAAQGTIESFVSTDDRFINFSISYPGQYSAISSSGRNLRRADISHLRADGQTNGRAALNVSAVAQVSGFDTVEINLARRGGTSTCPRNGPFAQARASTPFSSRAINFLGSTTTSTKRPAARSTPGRSSPGTGEARALELHEHPPAAMSSWVPRVALDPSLLPPYSNQRQSPANSKSEGFLDPKASTPAFPVPPGPTGSRSASSVSVGSPRSPFPGCRSPLRHADPGVPAAPTMPTCWLQVYGKRPKGHDDGNHGRQLWRDRSLGRARQIVPQHCGTPSHLEPRQLVPSPAGRQFIYGLIRAVPVHCIVGRNEPQHLSFFAV